MDMMETLLDFSKKASRQVEHLLTEEATKTALIMPFIKTLGYDVFDPTEVIPEFIADVGIKKGEKVDYAIKKDGKIIFLFECKPITADLNQVHASQLYRYFSVTEARFGILTNGRVYKFFSDLDEPNKMDAKPFFEFDIFKFESYHIAELKKFTKQSFDLDGIINTATELKYNTLIKNYLSSQFVNPSEDFIRFVAGKVYTGKMTQKIMEKFSFIVADGLKQFLREEVNNRIQSALDTPKPTVLSNAPVVEEFAPEKALINTTDEEMMAFNIIRAIGASVTNVQNIFMRDSKSYCAILFDDNNRKPVCRLYFAEKRKQIGVFFQQGRKQVCN